MTETSSQALETQVREAVAAEVDRRAKHMHLVLAIIGLIGLGTFGTLANYLIEKAVDRSLMARVGDIDNALNFSRFAAVSLKLRVGDSFSRQDVDAAMNYLRQTETNKKFRHRPEYQSAVFETVRAFSSAGQSAPLDELFALYEQELLANPIIVETLLHHYGQQVAGAVVLDASNPRQKTFEKLERVADGHNLAELAMAYRLLLESRDTTDETRTRVAAIITASRSLRPNDQSRMWREIIHRSRSANWAKRTNPRIQTIETAVRAFFADHAAVMEKVYGLSPEISARIASEGVSASQAVDIAAEMIISGRPSGL